MVFQPLKKHASDIVYLQKTKPCIRKHLITKADHSLVYCLCECADTILSQAYDQEMIFTQLDCRIVYDSEMYRNQIPDLLSQRRPR